MILFLCIIFAVYAVVIPLNHFFLMGEPLLWLNILGLIGGTIVMIVLDGFIAHITHSRQNKLNPFSTFFRVSRKQKQTLEGLGVRKFKKLVPELGKLVKFPKNKIADPHSPEYIFMYLKESCSGELGHWISSAAGFLYIAAFTFEPIYCLALGLPVAFTNFILMLMPALSLRYNRYSLEQIYRGLQKRRAKASSMCEE